MFLQSPIQRFGVTQLLSSRSQGFGPNQAYYKKYKDAFGVPLVGHNGIDVPIPNGDKLVAAHKGTVVRVQISTTSGNGIWILGDEMDFFNRKVRPRTSYWHIQEATVPVGARVEAGDLIALSDNTGDSTGPHLHFGLKFLENGQDLFGRNGYDGYVDSASFFRDRWAPGPIPGTLELNTIEVMLNLYKFSDENALFVEVEPFRLMHIEDGAG